MVVGAKVCDLTEDLLWFVCGLYMGILTSSLRGVPAMRSNLSIGCFQLIKNIKKYYFGMTI